MLQHANTVVYSKVQEDDNLLNDLTVHPGQGTMQYLCETCRKVEDSLGEMF